MLIGLYSMDLVPKEAADAASSLSGTFSYIFGSIVATLSMGLVVDYLGWGITFIILILSAILAVIFTLMSRNRTLEF